MLFRVLHVSVKPDKVYEWMAYTRDEGFPGMLRQPGCRQIWRLKVHGSENEYHIMTLWDSYEDLERFRASDDIKALGKASAGLTDAHRGETLYEVVPDRALNDIRIPWDKNSAR